METDITKKIHEHLSQYPKRKYPKGQILVMADESPDYIFYIVSGRVRKYDISYRGDEVIVNIFKPPAFFPMSWALNHTANTYYYKTEIPTELHVVPVDDALQFLKDNSDVTLDLLSRVYRGMDGLLGRVVHLMSGTAKSRVMYELIIECRRSGQKQFETDYELLVSEVDLAARSGLSRETVSREMMKLKEAGIVRISSKAIVVCDVAQLETMLGTAV